MQKLSNIINRLIIPVCLLILTSSLETIAGPEQKPGKWGFIDPSGKLIIPHQFEEVLPFRDGIAPVRLNQKWGLIDKSGKTILKCEWERCFAEKKQNAAIVVKKGKHGVISLSGKMLIEPKFDSIYLSKNGKNWICREAIKKTDDRSEDADCYTVFTSDGKALSTKVGVEDGT